MTYAAFRTSDKFYYSRPERRFRAARFAWDQFAEEGEIVSMRILDGEWMCKRSTGELDSLDAGWVRSKGCQTDRIGEFDLFCFYLWCKRQLAAESALGAL